MFFAIISHINRMDKETTIRVEEESKGFIFFKTFTVKWVMVNKTVEKCCNKMAKSCGMADEVVCSKPPLAA